MPTDQTPRLPDSKLRLIHVARRQLALTEDDYRATLSLYGGVDSAAMLDHDGFTAVMARFEELGFRSTSPRRPWGVRGGMASPAQVQLIRQLWAEFTGGQGTDATLGRWLERTFKVSALRFVTGPMAFKVVAGIKSMKAKQRARLPAERGPRVA